MTQTRLTTALEGRYTIDREVGRGGMATVYLARDVRHNRRVALKVLNPELGAGLEGEQALQLVVVENFFQELRQKAGRCLRRSGPIFGRGRRRASALVGYRPPRD